MKELEHLIKDIVKNARLKKASGQWVFSDEKIVGQILFAFNHFFKETGKQGGEIRKEQNPDYSAMGKKGMAKRWKKNKNPTYPS